MTFWERSEWMVPCVVRLLARKRYGRPLTEEEIAAASGLTVGHVVVISQQTDWSGIDVPTMRKFVKGCGCDFENRQAMRRVDCYLRSKPNWLFLKRTERWHTLYQPLMVKWEESKKGHPLIVKWRMEMAGANLPKPPSIFS